MRAYMSQAESGGNWWRQGQGSIPQWDLQAQAEREARRILAESQSLKRVHTYYGPKALRLSATLISVNGLSPAGFVVSAKAALTESLSSILPELDLLGAGAALRVIKGSGPYDQAAHDLWERNRAELARLESR